MKYTRQLTNTCIYLFWKETQEATLCLLLISRLLVFLFNVVPCSPSPFGRDHTYFLLRQYKPLNIWSLWPLGHLEKVLT
jgi:hypothetical protein